MNQFAPFSVATMALPGIEASDLVLVSRLYLGASIPAGGWVGRESFQTFLEEVVSGVFPDGYTVLGGQGAWKDTETGETIQEASRILEVAHGYQDLGKVKAVAQAYKDRFAQQAVMVSTVPATVSFV